PFPGSANPKACHRENADPSASNQSYSHNPAPHTQTAPSPSIAECSPPNHPPARNSPPATPSTPRPSTPPHAAAESPKTSASNPHFAPPARTLPCQHWVCTSPKCASDA